MTQVSTTANRRGRQRLQARGGTRLVCRKGTMGLGRNLAKTVRDLSERGTCVVLTELLALGTEVEMVFTSMGNGRESKITGTVAWVGPSGVNEYLTGVRFRDVLPYMALQDLTRRAGC